MKNYACPVISIGFLTLVHVFFIEQTKLSFVGSNIITTVYSKTTSTTVVVVDQQQQQQNHDEERTILDGVNVQEVDEELQNHANVVVTPTTNTDTDTDTNHPITNDFPNLDDIMEYSQSDLVVVDENIAAQIDSTTATIEEEGAGDEVVVDDGDIHKSVEITQDDNENENVVATVVDEEVQEHEQDATPPVLDTGLIANESLNVDGMTEQAQQIDLVVEGDENAVQTDGADTATSSIEEDVAQDSNEQEEGTTDGPDLKSTGKFMEEYINTKLDATDRTKSVVASRLRVMGVSPDIVEEMAKVDISIVISHCEALVNWIPDYIGNDFSIKDITIYSKCGNEVNGLETLQLLTPNVDVITLPNVGRCDHTYAYFIKEHYKSVEKDTNGNDIVMFLKDNSRHRRAYFPIDLLLSYVSRSGFACLTPPKCHHPLCKEDIYEASMEHSREYLLENFALPGYSRTSRETNEAFFTDKYSSLKHWKEEMGFVLPDSETMPVCFRGLFTAQKKQFLNQPEEVWENMVDSLSRADNLMEGHYAERMWASILSDNDEESAKAVDEVLSPHIGFIFKNGEFNPVKGQVYTYKNVQVNQNEEP